MAEIEMLLEQEIPSGRQSLIDSHHNLKKVASYCAQRYIEDTNKKAALDDTKNYTTQSLASVAYQINTLASNMLHMLDIQATHLSDMDLSISNIGQIVDTHKEKVARREIGLLTTDKVVVKDRQIVPPINPERSVKYVRKPLDFNELDDIGHGPKANGQLNTGSIRRSSASSTSTHSPRLSVDSGSRRDSLRSNVSTHGILRAIRAPTVPLDYSSNDRHLSAAYYRTNSNSSNESSNQIAGPPVNIPPPPAMAYNSSPNFVNIGGYKSAPQSVRPPLIPPNSGAGYNFPKVPNSTTVSSRPVNNTPDFYPNPSDFGIPPPPPPNIPTVIPPPPPPPVDSVSLVSSGGASSVHGYSGEPDWAPKNYLAKMIVLYDYVAGNPDELDLAEDQIVYVLKRNDDGWYEGVLNGVTGLFPGNYAEPISH